MALRADRHVVEDDISWFMNATGARGGIVSIVTAGSGAALDDASNVVAYNLSTGSGVVPVGVLLTDVVNVDQSLFHINQHKDEVNINNKVRVATDGWVVTDMLDPAATGNIAAGDTAFYTASGLLTDSDGGGVAVGRFLTTVDDDGFVKLRIHIDNAA